MLMVSQLVGFAGGARAEALVDRTSGTNIGDMTDNGGVAASFDGVLNQTAGNSSSKAASTSSYVGKTWSGAKVFSKAEFSPSQSGYYGGAGNVTLNVRGKNGAAPSSGSDGTLLGTTGAFTDETSGIRTVTSTDTVTSWDHWVFEVTHAIEQSILSEVTMYEMI